MKVYVIVHRGKWKIIRDRLRVYTNKESAAKNLCRAKMHGEAELIAEVDTSEIKEFLKNHKKIIMLNSGDQSDERSKLRNAMK